MEIKWDNDVFIAEGHTFTRDKDYFMGLITVKCDGQEIAIIPLQGWFYDTYVHQAVNQHLQNMRK